MSATQRRETLERNARSRGVLISLCGVCGQAYGEKDAQGVTGAVSDGVCPGGVCEDTYRVRMGLKPKVRG